MKIRNRYKPLLFVGTGILILTVFFWFVTRQTPLNKAIKELQSATDYDKSKEIWNEHKSDSFSDKLEWTTAVQNHLSNISLSSDQQTDLATWFPVRTYINVVVLPDLSGRLRSEPYPTENDKVVIDYIWQAFRETVSNSYKLYGQNSKDRLMVDMTRERELELKGLAGELIVDCSKTQQSSNPYLSGVEEAFHRAIDEVYVIGGRQTQGADYFKYINENLNDRRADSSPFVRFRNLAIILTDGYLETTEEPRIYYTGSPDELKNLRIGRRAGKEWNKMFASNPLPIQGRATSTPKLNGWDVLILQVRERDKADGDFYVLEKLWNDWLTRLGANLTSGLSFQKYQIAPENNVNVIAKFFRIDASKLTSSMPSVSINVPKKVVKSVSSIDKSKEYDNLLTEADNAIQSNDFRQGKLLFQKAAQLRETANLPISSKAEAVYQKYMSFADEAHQTFVDTKTDGLEDIPVRYYELAMLIKPNADVQRKLATSTNP